MITRRTADKWSLKKWEWFSRHSDPDKTYDENMDAVRKAIPELCRFMSGCAYCERRNKDDFCVLAEVYHRKCDGCCTASYRRWKDNPTKANARKVLADIRKAIKIREPK